MKNYWIDNKNNSIENNNNYNNTISNKKSNIIDDNTNKKKSLNIKQCRMLILPKIKDNITSTIKDSEKIERDLNLFKQRKREISKKKEEEKKSENNSNNLLDISPKKVYKLLFGINKRNSRKSVKIRNKNIKMFNTSNKKNENNNKNNNNNSIIKELILDNKTVINS